MVAETKRVITTGVAKEFQGIPETDLPFMLFMVVGMGEIYKQRNKKGISDDEIYKSLLEEYKSQGYSYVENALDYVFNKLRGSIIESPDISLDDLEKKMYLERESGERERVVYSSDLDFVLEVV